jgi:hypothetical protein
MAGNTAGAFITALRDQLATRVAADADFADVGVYIVGEGVSALDEAIFLVRPDDPIRFTQEHAAFGSGRRNDDFIVPGRLQVKSSGKASESSATFAAAMTRAQDLLDHVIEEIRDDPPAVGSQTLRSIVAEGNHTPYRTEDGWAVVTDFNIDVSVRVP